MTRQEKLLCGHGGLSPLAADGRFLYVSTMKEELDCKIEKRAEVPTVSPPANALVDAEIDLLGFRKPESKIRAGMKVLRVDRGVGNDWGTGFWVIGEGFDLSLRDYSSQRKNRGELSVKSAG